MSKATSWRKEMDKKIERNEQLLEKYKAEVKNKEMSILIQLAILGGHRRLKTINYASKEASFASKKTEIEADLLELESIGRSQRKAEYEKAQAKLLKSYSSYISTLTKEIQAVNHEINKYHLY